MSGHSADGPPGHAFISYVRQDRPRVARLQAVLEGAGVRVWRDTVDLRPGQDWKVEIRRAIKSDSLAFLACFSENTELNDTSYQNEELILATEQMRLRIPGVPWLIPVRFSECNIPDFDLGAGRTLNSLQRIDMFDGSWEDSIPRLLRTVLGIFQYSSQAPQAKSEQQTVASAPADVAADMPDGPHRAFQDTAATAPGNLDFQLQRDSAVKFGKEHGLSPDAPVGITGLSGAFSKGRSVEVTAQWALWGKESRDIAYRLLNYSNGTMGAESFEQAITRYSPGTLQDVPQVTVSWIPPRDAQDAMLALAIHERAEHLFDAHGRDVILTRYFCVPFTDLAIAHVSYQAMYERFREFRLPVARREPIITALPVAEPATVAVQLAMTAAAALLTKRRVCILGADRVNVDDRLRFLDTIAFFLPYGIRAKLSVATWTNGIFRKHKFRLFFTSELRDEEDFPIVWGRAHNGPVGDRYADAYLDWLRKDTPQRIIRLADSTKPVSLETRDIRSMLEQMGVLSAAGSAGSTSLPRATASVPPPHTQPLTLQDQQLPSIPAAQQRPHRDGPLASAPGVLPIKVDTPYCQWTRGNPSRRTPPI